MQSPTFESQPSEHPEILERWRLLQTRQDLAAMLEVSDRGLRELLYGIPEARLYTSFTLPKKSGGVRVIESPVPRLKSIQRRLLRILAEIYNPKQSAHGFVLNRSINTNAMPHVRRRFVLNIDIEDFFTSINFGRVRGLFLAQPYSCTTNVATVLAQICCFNGRLPQGAPTSPIVSNMICARLDSHLSRLAYRNKCRYTRYADDITISYGKHDFPPHIAQLLFVNGNESVVLGGALRRTIESNGFRINPQKTRLQRHNQRQIVTGLVTNQRVNVPRTYIRQVRAMLRNWELNGISDCQKQFTKKYPPNVRGSSKSRFFKDSLKGRIDFIGTVRGKNDPIYLKLLERLASLDRKLLSEPKMQFLKFVRNKADHILENLWVVESESTDGKEIRQGTGFFVKNLGIITCAHCIYPDSKIEVYRRSGIQRFEAEVIMHDTRKDLAVLKTAFIPEHHFEISLDELKQGDKISVAGFPHFALGNSGIVEEGLVIGQRKDADRNELTMISANILFGNSGGPVFDQNWMVVGVAARGNDSADTRSDRHFNQYIRIAEIFRLENKA